MIFLAVVSTMGTIGTQVEAFQAQTFISAKSMVNNEVGQQKSPETLASLPPVMLRDADYKSSFSYEDLKSELKQSINKSDVKTRAQMRAEKSALPKASTTGQKSGLSHLYIHDAAVYLYNDTDGDGYYSRLRVDFDVDSGYAEYFDVYAEMFIREEGTHDWIHYFTTDVFEIYHDDSSDDYSVTTTLNTGFPTGKYEVLIDLFEYGFSGVVDTMDAYSDPDLGNLPLEDATYEIVGVSSDTYVNTVKTEIFTDNDNDGFYRDFKISFDVDTQHNQSKDVFARLYQRTAAGAWQLETETQVFTVDGTSATDSFAIEGNWQSGYATTYYNFRIEVIDAATHQILDDVSNEFSSLLQVPLEDAGKDVVASSPVPPPASTTSSGSGGGSWSMIGLSLLGWFGWLRRTQTARGKLSKS